MRPSRGEAGPPRTALSGGRLMRCPYCRIRNWTTWTIALMVVAAILAPSRAAEPGEATRVRILMALYTKKGETPGKERVDGEAIQRVVEAGFKAQGLQGRYTLDVLSGDDATVDNVVKYYRDLKTSPSEALVFFYSGHGALS